MLYEVITDLLFDMLVQRLAVSLGIVEVERDEAPDVVRAQVADPRRRIVPRGQHDREVERVVAAAVGAEYGCERRVRERGAGFAALRLADRVEVEGGRRVNEVRPDRITSYNVCYTKLLRATAARAEKARKARKRAAETVG